MPIILDTDIGGEPDDALALAVAAGFPELSLVITSDENHGRRAKMARQLLDLLMRSDVPVVAGRDLGRTENWAAEGLVPESVPASPTDVLGAVDDLFGRTSGPVTWVGTGPMSNLADVLTAIPAAAQRLIVNQVGGSHTWITDRPEPTIGADLDAARTVLAAGVELRLLPVEITSDVLNVIDRNSVEYDVLARSGDPACILLRDHMIFWLEHYRSIDQSALLAFALAMNQPFFTVSRASIGLNEIGRVQPGEHVVVMIDGVDYLAFNTWTIPLLAGIKNLQYTVISPTLPPIKARSTREIIDAYQAESRPSGGGTDQ